MKVIGKETLGDLTVLNGNTLFELQRAIQNHLQTSDRLSGLEVRLMLANLELLDPVLIPLVEKHSKVIEKYVKKDSNGGIEKSENGFVFSNEKDKKDYDKASKAIWEEEIKLELSKFSVDVFDKMTFNMSKNNTVYLIYKYLVIN